MTACDVRMFGDNDGAPCCGDHHPHHTYSSTSGDVGANDGQHG